MSDLGLTKESVKGLGPGAYLVNVLPSAVLVLGLLAFVTSHLYPWQTSARTPAGVDSVVTAFKHLGTRGAIALVLTVLVTTVLLRPFQISAVQFLEGYWRSRVIPPLVTALAIERHARRRSLHMARALEIPEDEVATPSLDLVTAQARRQHRADRRTKAATDVVARYPERAEWIMPTLLGNVLRRAETTAGERYGLQTVLAYPRLYPYLSPLLREEHQVQLNVLDTAATMAIVCGVLAACASPLLVRLDGWSLVSVGLAVVSGLSYRGARIAAQNHAILLAAAFDLHRFDMLAAMHRRLPPTAVEELADNQALCNVLGGAHLGDHPEPASWAYTHESIHSLQAAEPDQTSGPSTPTQDPARDGRPEHR
jgi:hypothetical protein